MLVVHSHAVFIEDLEYSGGEGWVGKALESVGAVRGGVGGGIDEGASVEG